ncbi:MAG: hypothetical protein GX998_00080 [Firmicutes bacterium]|nr:hypothetical protein [Bacillota bacterium]
MGNSSMEYILGIDCSTSGTKACLWDLGGTLIVGSSSPHSISRPYPGWSEQSPTWYEALTQALHRLFTKTTIRPHQIAAMGITHQRHSFVAVDENYRPLGPAILWNDVRCQAEIDFLTTEIGKERLYRATGIPPGPWSLAKILWLKHNQPDLFSQAHKFLLVHDYLVYQLTGELCTTESSASAMGCLDIINRQRWAAPILTALDIPIDKFVPSIQPAGSLLGTITPVAAKATGLRIGTPVIATAGDQVCGCLAVGLTQPYQVGVNSGTSLTFQTLSAEPVFDPDCHYILEISPLGYYAPETVVFSGVSDLLQWYRHGFATAEERQAQLTGLSIWQIIFDAAASIRPGCDGLMLFPFFQGVQAPYWSNDARGALIGLNTTHTRHHVARAILEGLAYESRRQIQLLESGTGTRIREILLYGGAAQNRLWCQTLANITGRRVRASIEIEASALGAAICAAWGIRSFPSLEAAITTMRAPHKSFMPDKHLFEFHDRLYNEVYKVFYDRIQDIDSLRTKLASSSV